MGERLTERSDNEMGRGFGFSAIPHVYLPAAVDVESGLDRWEFEEDAYQAFLALHDEDREAFRIVRELLRRWGKRGAHRRGEPRLVVPSGKHVFKYVRFPPWLGEVKVAQTSASRKGWRAGMPRQFRLYFLDIADRPGEPAQQMLVSLSKEKKLFGPTRKDEVKANRAQDNDIKKAMHIGKRWCAENGVAYRPWPIDSVD